MRAAVVSLGLVTASAIAAADPAVAPIPAEPDGTAVPGVAAAAGPAATAEPVVAAVGGSAANRPVAGVPALAVPAEQPEVNGTALTRRRDRDAAAGRSFFAETAITQPRGRATLDVRAPTAPVVAVGLRYGATDRIELQVGAIGVGVDDDGAGVLSVGAKLQLWSNDRLALAVGGSAYAVDDEVLYQLHATGTACFGDDCDGTITASLNAFAMRGESEVPVLAGLGLTLGKKNQLVAELHETRERGGDTLRIAYFGGRYASARYSLDGGLGLFSEEQSYDGEVEVLPMLFLGVAARL